MSPIFSRNSENHFRIVLIVFPMYYIHSDLSNRFKTSTTRQRVTRLELINRSVNISPISQLIFCLPLASTTRTNRLTVNVNIVFNR